MAVDCGLSTGAQVSLELESQTTYFFFPDGKPLLTRQEYVDQYRQDNGLQATNSVTVTVQHFNEKAVSDLRKKATPALYLKPRGRLSRFHSYSRGRCSIPVL